MIEYGKLYLDIAADTPVNSELPRSEWVFETEGGFVTFKEKMTPLEVMNRLGANNWKLAVVDKRVYWFFRQKE